MKVEEEVKKEELNPIEEGLSDLSVTDEQAEQTKGSAGEEAVFTITVTNSGPGTAFDLNKLAR